MNKQKHFGKYWSEVYNDVREVWHTKSDGTCWIGVTPHNIAPVDLYCLTLSTLSDLLKEYPNIHQEMIEKNISVAYLEREE